MAFFLHVLGVESGKGQNGTLWIFPMPFHNIEEGIFVDAEITSDPAVATPFADSLVLNDNKIDRFPDNVTTT